MMSWLSRLGNVFRTSKVDADLDEELRYHREARVGDLIAQGLSRVEAEAEAARRFGNTLLLREQSRDVKLLPWLESILQDVRFGARSLRKNAVVTGAAMISLSLAIGACAAAFSLVDALLLRPLPVREPERLVYLTFAADVPDQDDRDSFAYPLFERLRADARPYIDLFGTSYQSIRRAVFPDTAEQDEKVRAQYVSGDAFAILGVRAALGRLLTAADDVRPGGHPVAVLSHRFWTRRFGGDPSVIGRSFRFEQRAFEIVGVAEPRFIGVEPGRVIDLWVPNMMWRAEALTHQDWSWFRILGRLKNGVSPEQARSALQATFSSVRRDRAAQVVRPGEQRERIERYVNTPLTLRSAANGPSELRKHFERPLWILVTVVALVLLIAGSNVANLFLARAAAREHEMSLRLSIGASRGRLIQQVLIESALLAGAASAFGFLFASAAAPIVVGMLAPSDSPAYLDLRMDWRLVAFLGTLGLLTTMLFGLAPALRASGTAPVVALKAAGERTGSRVHLLRPLVAAQVAFSLVVLFLGGLLLLSFAKLTKTDLGFTKSGVVLLRIESELKDPEQARDIGLQLIDRVRRLPGVHGAGLSGWALFSGSGWSRNIRLPGRGPEASDPYFLGVSPGWFETMRIRLLDGRTLEPRDTEPKEPSSVVVNEAFARHYFGGRRAVGLAFGRVDRQGIVQQDIVGVVANAKYLDLRRPAPPTVYVPHRGLGTLHVRTADDPLALTSTVRREIQVVHPSLRVTDVYMQSTLVDNTLLRERLLALLSGFFALVGLLLAAVGVYGVLTYSVVQRTREIGIRMALGARPLVVVRSVLMHIGWALACGIGVGLAGGLYVARFVGPLLFEVEPLDIWSIALPVAVMLSAAILAALPPARRAARVDPIIALRYE